MCLYLLKLINSIYMKQVHWNIYSHIRKTIMNGQINYKALYDNNL